MEIKFYDESGRKSYSIHKLDNPKERYWLKNQDGEGMEIHASLIFELIDEFFKKNY